MKPHKNRYAWSDAGPLVVRHGGNYTTEQVKRFLKDRGIRVTQWARNWAEFIGWATCEVEMKQPAASA